MINHIIHIIRPHFCLPLLIPEPDWINLNFLLNFHELPFLFAWLCKICVNISASLLKLIAVHSALDFRANFRPDYQRTELSQLAYPRPESQLENVVVHFKAQILRAQGVDFLPLGVDILEKAHQILTLWLLILILLFWLFLELVIIIDYLMSIRISVYKLNFLI